MRAVRRCTEISFWPPRGVPVLNPLAPGREGWSAAVLGDGDDRVAVAVPDGEAREYFGKMVDIEVRVVGE